MRPGTIAANWPSCRPGSPIAPSGAGIARPPACSDSCSAASSRSCCCRSASRSSPSCSPRSSRATRPRRALGEQAAGDPAAVAAFKHHYGLDKPLPAPLRDLPRPRAARRPRPVVADARRGQPRPRPVHSGDGGARALLDHHRCDRRHRVRRRRGAAAQPADRSRRFASRRSRASRCRRSGSRSIALYVGFYRLGWFPGAERLDPGTLPPPSVTGLYTIDALLAGKWALFVPGAAPPRAARARARRVQREPADPLHALGRARGDRERLRARGARQGHARAGRRRPLHPARARCRRSSPCSGSCSRTC